MRAKNTAWFFRIGPILTVVPMNFTGLMFLLANLLVLSGIVFGLEWTEKLGNETMHGALGMLLVTQFFIFYLVGLFKSL